MNRFLLNDVNTGEGLSDIVEFFNVFSASGDVGGALLDAGVWFKIALFLIIMVGAISMAIWIVRISVDILLIVTRGTNLDKTKIGSLGTGKDGSYDSVGKYIGGNIVEIILVIILITFLMSGWLFRLIALAISGFGILANKLFNLDIDGGLSKMDAEAFVDNVGMLRANEAKAEYDDRIGAMKSQAELLYGYAKEGLDAESPKFQKAKRIYTSNFAQADVISTQKFGEGGGAITALRLPTSYFARHLDAKRDLCNPNFFDETILEFYNGKITVANSCTGAVAGDTETNKAPSAPSAP